MSQTASRRQFLTGKLATNDFCLPTGTAPEPSLAWHGANRMMFGPRPGDVERIASMGFPAFVEEQLNPEAIDDSVAEAMVAAVNLVTLSESDAQLWDRVGITYSESARPLFESIHATWLRMVNSERQLYEKMVNFWHEHFSINGYQFVIRSLFPQWDRTIRAHAFGNFRDFLEATAESPCMLYYLDNYVNSVSGPNENYARELIELHTMGSENYRPGIIDDPTCNSQSDADGDGMRDWYVDNDIYESARCFTGWTLDRDNDSTTRGQFVYRGDLHDRFNKFVLCRYIPDSLGDQQDGRRVLDNLANHPGTARHLCGKLCRRFVSDDPPQSLIESAAAVWMANREEPDQIKRVARHILLSDEFAAAKLQKFKRPVEWVTSTMRVLGIPYVENSSFNMTWFYNPMGQPTFGWNPPDGPPDTKDYWATSNGMLRRWNFIYMTASNWFSSHGFVYTTEGIAPDTVTTARETAQFWIQYLIGRPVNPATKESLARFVAEGRNLDFPLSSDQREEQTHFLAAMSTMSPDFMKM